eukprot:m.9212 g.9212  ORF g.9212 m.9212 type:complete len:940 (+) comp6301_c0_seq4:25-2844(+)
MCFNVVVLHGKHQCGEVFRQRIARVQKTVERELPHVKFYFPDALYELPLKEGDDVPTRTWWRDNRDDDLENALVGLETYCLKEDISSIHCIFGFSQGAILATLMCHPDVVTSFAPKLQTFLLALKGIVVAGLPFQCFPPSPHTSNEGLFHPSTCVKTPSLHFVGEKDTTLVDNSIALINTFFEDSTIVEHPQGHVFPSKADQTNAVLSFLLKHVDGVDQQQKTNAASSTSYFTITEEQEEELESLCDIYGDDVQVLSRSPPQLMFYVIVTGVDGTDVRCLLNITLTKAYPDDIPIVSSSHVEECVGVKQSNPVASGISSVIKEHLHQVAQESVGMAMCVTLVMAFQEWIEQLVENISSGVDRLSAFGEVQLSQENGDNADADAKMEEEEEAKGSQVHRSRKAAIKRMMEEDAELGSCGRAVVDCNEDGDNGGKEKHTDKTEDGRQFTKEETPLSKFICSLYDTIQAQHPSPYTYERSGVWKYTIGLVGKPSAGKSTFFNAITEPTSDADTAKVASYPFTTIDPNVGQGYFKIEHPMNLVKELPLPAQAPKFKKVPVIVKDVAGLVPGAYKGRGKGNSFLNDLCDADVLIHIVDGSGKSDENGVILSDEQRDPVSDVLWIKEELHRWIFNNIRCKWGKCLRSVDNFLSMFTGYQCRTDLVLEALKRAGSPMQTLSEDMLGWGPRDLHKLVAHFLHIRFPIMIALNKVDEASPEFIRSVIKRLATKGNLVKPTCARLEWTLCQLEKQGAVKRTDQTIVACDDERGGSGDHGLVNIIDQHQLLAKQYPSIQGSGVVDVVNSAVHLLRPPLVLFPVKDLESFQSLTIEEHAEAALSKKKGNKLKLAKAANETSVTPPSPSTNVLEECILVYPKTSAGDAYDILNKAPFAVIHGEFVRCDCYDFALQTKRVMKRTEHITHNTSIIKISTNKRKGWQKKNSTKTQ